MTTNLPIADLPSPPSSLASRRAEARNASAVSSSSANEGGSFEEAVSEVGQQPSRKESDEPRASDEGVPSRAGAEPRSEPRSTAPAARWSRGSTSADATPPDAAGTARSGVADAMADALWQGELRPSQPDDPAATDVTLSGEAATALATMMQLTAAPTNATATAAPAQNSASTSVLPGFAGMSARTLAAAVSAGAHNPNSPANASTDAARTSQPTMQGPADAMQASPGMALATAAPASWSSVLPSDTPSTTDTARIPDFAVVGTETHFAPVQTPQRQSTNPATNASTQQTTEFASAPKVTPTAVDPSVAVNRPGDAPSRQSGLAADVVSARSTAEPDTAGADAATRGLSWPTQQVASAIGTAAADLAAPTPTSQAGFTQTTAFASPTKVLRLALQPADLGSVTVHMSMKDNVLRLRVEADSAETAEMLRKDRDALSSLMTQSGIAVGGLVVDAAQSSNSQPQAGRSDTGQGQGFAFANGQSQSGEGSRGSQSGASGGHRQESQRSPTSPADRDAAAPDRRAQSGEVYL